MANTNNYQPAREVTFTTTGNIDDLDFSKCGIIRMNNASLSTIRGLKAGFAGQRVTIVSVGAGKVDLAHQNTNSTAANRLINFATSASTPLAAGVGSATYEYDDTTARWRLISHDQGAWITAAFSAGDFTSNTGSWTVASGDVLFIKYFLLGRMMYFSCYLQTTTIAGGPAALRISNAQWGGFTSTNDTQIPCRVKNGGTYAVGLLAAGAAGTVLSWFVSIAGPVPAWANEVDLAEQIGSIFFEVN